MQAPFVALPENNLVSGLQDRAQGFFSDASSALSKPLYERRKAELQSLAETRNTGAGTGQGWFSANPDVSARASYIRDGLIKRGLPAHVADGFLMNMMDESGLNPGINERNPTVAGSRGGYGLDQLTGSRRVAYENWAKSQGIPFDNIDAQLDWKVWELNNTETRARDIMWNTSNAGQAAAAAVNYFYRPAAEHRASRSSKYLGHYSNAISAYGRRPQ